MEAKLAAHKQSTSVPQELPDFAPNITWPAPGCLVVAVSGGADSMALLDLFASQASRRGYRLVVAHFDHRMRPDSVDDARLVQQACIGYGLPLVWALAQTELTSEAEARAARYQFLHSVQRDVGAQAVLTGHHLDDALETSILNITRGSGWRGAVPFRGAQVLRPLQQVTSDDLRKYAVSRSLKWVEDPTNANLDNPRNFLRHELLANASPSWRTQYTESLDRLAASANHIDRLLNLQVKVSKNENENEIVVPRDQVVQLSLEELSETFLAAFRSLRPGVEPNRRLLQELALFAKTGRPGRMRPVGQGLYLRQTASSVIISGDILA